MVYSWREVKFYVVLPFSLLVFWVFFLLFFSWMRNELEQGRISKVLAGQGAVEGILEAKGLDASLFTSPKKTALAPGEQIAG